MGTISFSLESYTGIMVGTGIKEDFQETCMLYARKDGTIRAMMYTRASRVGLYCSCIEYNRCA